MVANGRKEGLSIEDKTNFRTNIHTGLFSSSSPPLHMQQSSEGFRAGASNDFPDGPASALSNIESISDILVLTCIALAGEIDSIVDRYPLAFLPELSRSLPRTLRGGCPESKIGRFTTGLFETRPPGVAEVAFDIPRADEEVPGNIEGLSEGTGDW
jgi:hypothetical protein